MDGSMILPSPLRPVPVYCRRPLDLDPSPSSAHGPAAGGGRCVLSSPRDPRPRLSPQTAPRTSPPVPSERLLPLTPTPAHQHGQPLPASLPPHLAQFPFPHHPHPAASLLQRRLEVSRGYGDCQQRPVGPETGKRPACPAGTDKVGGPVQLPTPPSAGKSGVPVITPVRGPDPHSLLLYQALLRAHPAYQQLLDNYVLPPNLPPLLFFPPPALCAEPPLTYSLSSPLPSRHEERPRPAGKLSEDVPASSASTSSSPLAGSFSSATFPAGSPPAKPREASHRPVEGSPAAVLSPAELVSSITAVQDPYQQYGYGRKLFPCPQCRYTTDRRNNLKRHMLTMHQLSAKLLECCGVLFRTKAALREHALIFHYHGYTCFYCGRRFCRKALLKRHLSVHNGQKEFICNVCDYATSHKSNLERHRRVHMRQDDDISGLEDAPPDGPRVTLEHISDDEISVCSHDDDENEEINVNSD